MNLRLILLLLLLAFAGSGCAAVITSSEVGPTDPLTQPIIEEEPAAAQTATPEPAEPTPVAETASTFCPEIARPALFLLIPDQGHQVLDPVTGERCALDQLNSEALLPRFGGDDLFYMMRGVNQLGVYRVQPGGEPQALPAVSVTIEEGAYADLSFIISSDGTTIAWGVMASGQADQTTSDLLVAPVSTDEGAPATALVSRSEPEPRVLQPVRFSADNSTLYYTLAPMGIGGSWISFNGRYDNLYAVPTAGGEPTLIFDCQEREMMLCLGDFQVHENEVLLLAFVDDRAEEKAIVLLNGQGEELNRLALGGDYVGYPTVGPAGELVFYSAELSEESLLPEAAILYRVAPPNAPAEALANDAQLVLPQRFLDDSTVVVSYAHDEMRWGLALVSMRGEMTVVEGVENAQLIDVLR